ncbi:hypothetical protein MASR2M66_16050 [Chloroflexota bacterium]
MNTNRTSNWIAGFLFGSLIGAGVALLNTSRTGQENRELILEKVTDARNKANSTVSDMRNRIETIKANVVDKTQNRFERLKEIGQQVSQAEVKILKEGAQDAKEVLTS